MKRFHSTLQSVRRLREQKEQDAMQLYASTMKERQRAAMRLAAAEETLNQHCADWQAKVVAGCPAFEVIHCHHQCQSLEQEREKCRRTMEEADQKMRQALLALLAAQRERKIVDRFEEIQRTAYDRQLTRQEQKELDELALRGQFRPENV